MDRELATKLIIEDRLPLLTRNIQDSYVAIHAKIGGPPGNHKVALELIVEHEDYLESQGFFKFFNNTEKCTYVGEGKNGNIEKADLENMLSLLAKYLEYCRELDRMSYETFIQKYEEVRLRRLISLEKEALEFDQRQFFSFPEAAPDWDYWLGQPNWTLEEAAALSFGKDPDSVNDQKLSSIRGSEQSLFIKDFRDFRRRQAKAQVSGLLKDPTDLTSFVTWIEKNQILLPNTGIRTRLANHAKPADKIFNDDHTLNPAETRTQAIHSLAIIPLTNPFHEPKDSRTDPGDDPKSVGAPACKIEVTPEMIEVGAEVIWAHFFEATAYASSEGRDLAYSVFVAMFDLLPMHAKIYLQKH